MVRRGFPAFSGQMTDTPTNVLRPSFRKLQLIDCQREKPMPVSLTDALSAFKAQQARTRAEIARDKIEEGYAELKAAAGTDAAQECLRSILLLECAS